MIDNKYTMKLIEVVKLNIKGVYLYVKIDYIKKTISFVDVNKLDNIKDDGQLFLFKDRGLEYMNGWKAVVRGIEEAICWAEERLKEAENKKIEEMLEVMEQIDNE